MPRTVDQLRNTLLVAPVPGRSQPGSRSIRSVAGPLHRL